MTTNMETATPMQRTAGIILDSMNATCIFNYGSRQKFSTTSSLFSQATSTDNANEHYDFLVITNDKSKHEQGKLMKIKERDSYTPITCTLIVHTLKELKQGIRANNRFFHTVLNHAEKLYAKPGLLCTADLVPFDEHADNQLTLKNSQAYYEQLEVYSQMLSINQNLQTCIPLFHTQLEHSCLLLIYVMMGYRPENYDLKSLLNLCSRIDTRLEVVIPRITAADRYHYKLLLKGAWNGQYGKDREPIIAHLYKACDDFTGLVEEICANKLQQMQDRQ